MNEVTAVEEFSWHTQAHFGGVFPARSVRVTFSGFDNLQGETVAEHDHHETDELDYERGDFWLQIECSESPELSLAGNGDIWDRRLYLSTSGNVANGTVLTTLLLAYLGFHERLLANHQCSHPDCRLVWVHRQLHDMLETALDQTAHLLEGCDEEPEAGSEEEDDAEETPG